MKAIKRSIWTHREIPRPWWSTKCHNAIRYRGKVIEVTKPYTNWTPDRINFMPRIMHPFGVIRLFFNRTFR